MADFQQALPYTLAHEGGWANDPDDPGGATMMGITLATAQKHGIRTKEALRAITQDQVAAIYRADYWRFDGLASQQVATKLFDMAVNMGLIAAVRLAQEALNRLGCALVPDGMWGPVTEAAANAANPEALLAGLCMASEKRYRAIVQARPRSAKFLAGWLRRAKEVPHA